MKHAILTLVHPARVEHLEILAPALLAVHLAKLALPVLHVPNAQVDTISMEIVALLAQLNVKLALIPNIALFALMDMWPQQIRMMG